MNRRLFFGSLAAAVAAAAGPERLIWTPGKKKIFIPPARPKLILKVGDIIYCASPESLWRLELADPHDADNAKYVRVYRDGAQIFPL